MDNEEKTNQNRKDAKAKFYDDEHIDEEIAICEVLGELLKEGYDYE